MLSSLLKSNDLLLYALAFLLFNEKADDDLLLAIIYIMMGKNENYIAEIENFRVKETIMENYIE